MKILTLEEKNKLKYVANVGNRRSEFTEAIMKLDHDSLFITREEWKQKGYKLTPRRLLTAYYYNVNSKLHGQKFVVKTTKDGWVVSRL